MRKGVEQLGKGMGKINKCNIVATSKQGETEKVSGDVDGGDVFHECVPQIAMQPNNPRTQMCLPLREKLLAVEVTHTLCDIYLHCLLGLMD